MTKHLQLSRISLNINADKIDSTTDFCMQKCTNDKFFCSFYNCCTRSIFESQFFFPIPWYVTLRGPCGERLDKPEWLEQTDQFFQWTIRNYSRIGKPQGRWINYSTRFFVLFWVCFCVFRCVFNIPCIRNFGNLFSEGFFSLLGRVEYKIWNNQM